MGKEATQVADQRFQDEQIGGEQFKNQQFTEGQKQQVSAFPYGETMDSQLKQDPYKDLNKDFHGDGKPIAEGMNQGSGLELRQPTGGFHGDKWQDMHDGGQFKSDHRDTQLMEDPNAGGFHGDKWKEASKDDQQWSALPPTHSGNKSDMPLDEQFKRDLHFKGNQHGEQFQGQQFQGQQFQGQQFQQGQDSHLTNRMGDQWPGDSLQSEQWKGERSGEQWRGFQDQGTKNDMIKNETREAKQSMHAELKSHASTHDELIKPSELPNTQLAGMTDDGRTVMPEPVTLHDGRSFEGTTTIHDGRTNEEMPLKERVVQGVHAGDPLSTSSLFHKKDKAGKKEKKDKKKFKKEKDKDAIHTGFPKDEHLKSDKGLIPHEHLKKDEPLLASEHLSGGTLDSNLQDDKHLKDDKLHNDAKWASPQVDSAVHGGQLHGTGFNQDAQLNKDLHKDDPMRTKDTMAAGDTNLNNELRDKDAYLTTADNLNKNSPHAEDQGAKKGKLKDKVHRKKEKLKEKLGLKKDEELKVGSTEHHTTHEAHPKGHEIATIKIPGIESGDRAAQEMVNQQAKAKKELNAELKEHAGHSDHIAPSEIHNHGIVQNLHESRAVDTQLSMPANNLPSGAMNDHITRDQVVAKSEVNADIKNHAGEMGFADQIKPSEIAEGQFQKPHEMSEKQFQARDDQFRVPASQFQNDQFQKNDLQSQQFQHQKEWRSGEFQNDQFQKRDLEGQQFQNKDWKSSEQQFENKDWHSSSMNQVMHADNQFQNKDWQKDNQFQKRDLESQQFQSHNLPPAERIAGFEGTSDPVMREHIQAKQDLNAELKDQAGLGSGDHIMPSDIHTKDSFAKDSFGKDSFAGDRNFSGLGAMNDDIMKDHILAKKELNAEIKSQAGLHNDQILPSEIATKEPAAGHSFATNESMTNQDFAGHQDFANKDFANKDFANKDFANKDFANKDFANKDFANKDFANKDFANQDFANKDFANKDFATQDFAHKDLNKDFASNDLNMRPDNRSGGLDANNDQIMKDHVQAKKEVNAEIKDLATTHTDHIVPSEITSSDAPLRGTDRLKSEMDYEQARDETVTEEAPHLSTKDKIKEKVSAAAHAVKETFKLH